MLKPYDQAFYQKTAGAKKTKERKLRVKGRESAVVVNKKREYFH
jgi:hypothetical protein